GNDPRRFARAVISPRLATTSLARRGGLSSSASGAIWFFWSIACDGSTDVNVRSRASCMLFSRKVPPPPSVWLVDALPTLVTGSLYLAPPCPKEKLPECDLVRVKWGSGPLQLVKVIDASHKGWRESGVEITNKRSQISNCQRLGEAAHTGEG